MSINLKEKAIKGISWNLIENISTNLVRLIIGIVLARLLTPADFGLIGMVTIFFSIADVFINGGFGQAYIQKKNATNIDANTVFIINFTVGILGYILFWLIAPFISIYFNQPLLIDLIRIMAIIIVINSLNIIQLSILRKDLSFKKRTIITVVSVLFSGIIGIYCAYSGFGVWSLVIQQIVSKLFLSIGLYLTSRWRFSFEFSKESFKNMFSFGIWLLFSNLISVLFNNMYRFVIGKIYPVSELGLFDKGQQFPSLISQQLTWSVNMVALPVLSKLQDRPKELQEATSKFIKYISFVSIPLLLILIIVAEPFVILLLTSKWIAMVIYLQLFCLVGIFVPFIDINIQVFQAIGKTKISFIIVLIRNIIRIINVIIAFRFGVKFIVIGEIITSIITYLLLSILSKNYVGYSFFSQLKEMRWIGISVLLSGLIAKITFGILTSLYNQLFITGFVMATSYLIFMYIFQRQFIIEIYSLRKFISVKA